MKNTTATCFEELPALLTVKDLQSALNISRVKSYELINQDGFPSLRFGRAVRIPKEPLIQWLNQQVK